MSSDDVSNFRRVTREDTIEDATLFDFTVSTPLVFAAQPSDELPPLKEEELVDGVIESRTDFPGPQKWEETYQAELQGEADRILQSFTKTPVDSNFDSSLPQASTAADDNLTDRLGKGFLDPATLMLQTQDANALHYTSSVRRSLGATQFARITSRMGFHSRSASRIREERRRQELRDRVLPSSSSFSPEFYLSHVHAETSLSGLQAGMRFLEVELSKRTGQLKTLVKEHFEGFISCKNSIDDVHVRLRRNETQNSGANTTSLKASLAAVQTELLSSFSPILERQDKLEQLKHVMEILKRFQSSFNLPSNIRQLSHNRDFQQVVSEYRRAKSTMAGAEATIWRSLFEEVKKETTDVCMKIHKTLEDALLDVDEVQDLITCLCQLRNEGLEFAFTVEPVSLWLMHVEEHVHQEIDRLTRRHRRQVESSVQLYETPKKRSTLPAPYDRDVSRISSLAETPCVAQQCTEYMTRLCLLLAEHLPKLWKLKRHPQLQKMPDIDQEIQKEIWKELDSVDAITRGIMDAFTGRIVLTVENMLMSDGLLSPCVFTLLKELRLFASDMKVSTPGHKGLEGLCEWM